MMNSTESALANGTFEQSAIWARYQSRFIIRYGLVMFLCYVIGLINLFCCVTIWTTRALRKGSGILIGHMVLVETSMCLVFLPASLTMTYVHMQSHAGCRAFMFFFANFNNVVHYDILCLAINRFVAVVYPTRYRQISRPRWCAAFIAGSWLICIVLNIPMEFINGVGHYGFDPVWGGCSATLPLQPKQFDYRQIQLYSVLCAPIVLTGALYGLILTRVWWKPNRVSIAPAETPQQTRRSNLYKLLFVCYVIYSSCFLSLPVLARLFPKAVSSYPMLSQWMIVAVVCGYSVHPIFLMTMNKDHRTAANSILRRLAGRLDLAGASHD